MATAEFAVAIPAVLLVLVLALSALATAADQIRCIDAARAAARALARGDSVAAAQDEVRRLAPSGAQLRVVDTPGHIEVTVTGSARPGLRWAGAAAIPRGHAVAAREDVTLPVGGS